MKQYGFFIDISRCTGCKTCTLACKDYKELGPNQNFRRVYEYTGGNWKKSHASISCRNSCWSGSGNASNSTVRGLANPGKNAGPPLSLIEIRMAVPRRAGGFVKRLYLPLSSLP